MNKLPADCVIGGFWRVMILSAAALTAVTSGSFWIDEFSTHKFANMPTLQECWSSMERTRFPEIQAPFYMAYIWAWTYLFGSNEWTMRFAGTPWFVAGAMIFATHAGRLMRGAMLVTLLAAFSPFAWYYLNEARVYAFQLGFAMAAVGTAITIGRAGANNVPDPVAQRIFVFALVGLCGSNVLGAVFGFTLFIALLISVPPRYWRALLRATPISIGAGALLLTGLAAYYAWTITLHPQATVVGTTTPQTTVFVFYELFGFVGLGPGRNTLRNEGAGALKAYLPVLICFAGAVTFVAWLGIREVLARLGRRKCWLLVLVVLAPLLTLIGIGMAKHFRLLGRHVTPMLPLLLLLLSFGVARAIRSGNGPRSIAGTFCLLWLGSSFSIRWADWQQKDEYRGAAAIAREAIQRGEIVWWNADFWGATYYGLPLDDGAARNFYPLINASTQQLQNLPIPNVVIVSKPDIYDAKHGVALYLRKNRYPATKRLPAFVVYRRSEGR